MSEQLTIYTIRSKNTTNVWVFKYDLNGFLTVKIITYFYIKYYSL